MKGSLDWKLHPQLHPFAIDNIVHKQHGNAFEETNLEESLRRRNVTSLVIAGLVTHGCVRVTCIGALKSGYQVILVKDGHSNFSQQAVKLFDDWNQKLGALGVKLAPASQVEF